MDSLYHFRDHYFESHPLSEADVKDARVEDRMKECLQRLDELKAEEQQPSAEALYHRGRALNVLPAHSPESERLLSRAVKLRPALAQAWNELGECYAKRGDADNARTCFEGALRHGDDASRKVSLRNLSILMRQQKPESSSGASAAEDRLKNIEQGLAKAREVRQNFHKNKSVFDAKAVSRPGCPAGHL